MIVIAQVRLSSSGHESRLFASDFLNTMFPWFSHHHESTGLMPTLQPKCSQSLTCVDELSTMTRMSPSIVLD